MLPGRLLAAGEIQAPTKVDLHGYSAKLVVDQALSGHVHLGETLSIGWEELSEGRPARFDEKDRVLVCLEPMPNYSLWKKRFPAEKGTVWAVCGRGQSFLRDPNGATTYLLRHFLGLGSSGVSDPAGQAYLGRLAAEGSEPVAFEAVKLLATNQAQLADRATIDPLLEAVRNPDRDRELRQQAFLVLGHRKAKDARERLEKLTVKGFDLRASAIHSVALIDGGIPKDTVQRYLSDEEAEVRGVAVLYSDKDDTKTLRKILTEDPDTLVRILAINKVFQLYQIDALDDVLPLLGDPDDKIRAAAAKGSGGLGAPAIPRLKEVALGDNFRAAQGAVLAISLTGKAGMETMGDLAHNHPDKRIQALAKFTLGEAPSPDPHSH